MTLKMTTVTFIITILLSGLALTTVFTPHQILIWKLSILTTEYGHWFGLMIVVIGLFLMKYSLNDRAGVIQILLLLISLMFFSRPLVQARLNSNRYADDLKKTLGVSVPSPMVSISQLWLGGKEKPVIPKQYSYFDQLNLDFYRATSSVPTPWVVIVHGGGWDSGSKSEFSEFNSHIVHQGYSVAAITYRLAPEHKWPAQKQDVLAAVAFIKANAAELNVDPDRWALLGRSAGGQIAQSVAYQHPDTTLKGIIAFYSPSDLDFAYRNTTDHDIINSRSLLVNLLGGDPDKSPNAYSEASPLNFVTNQAPPTLLLHGRPDPLTWFRHSQRLIDKINHVGAKGSYIELPWATHAFDFNLNGPGGQIAKNSVDGFLAAVFGSPNGIQRSQP